MPINLIIDGFNGEVINTGTDSLDAIGKFTTDTVNMYLIVAKGTYANLATAQADLAGTSLIYQFRLVHIL